MSWTDIEYFDEEEFTCPCGCKENNMDPGLIYKLDAIRELSGYIMMINSGFRCPEHNGRVGGSTTSSHLRGLAVDIRTFSSHGRYLLIKASLQRGIPRIGVAETFVHLDVDTHGKPGSLIWTY